MIKKILKNITESFGFRIVRTKSDPNRGGKFGCLPHEGEKKGNVLLSYIVEPFLLQDEKEIPNTHDHYWVSWQIGRTFAAMGYDVDVVEYDDGNFVPQKKYDFLIGARTNFERLSGAVPSSCIKILHLDTAHWLFNNSADYRRHLELQKRRGVALSSFKRVEPNWAIECADYAIAFQGNQFNVDTYRYADKPIIQIPVPTCAVYGKPENKDFNTCRNHFLWFGSDGLVHKGLDLVLEAFAQMPEYRLTVCGPLRNRAEKLCKGPLKYDERFENEYHHELYECENIDTIGWVDIESDYFGTILNACIGVVFPSCSEGGGTSAITCMQAGLIPIVSYEASIEVADFGFVLARSTVDEIKETVRLVSRLPVGDLKARSYQTWDFCRSRHTRENFTKKYHDIITQIIDENKQSRG